MRKSLLLLLFPLFCFAQFKTGKDLIISLHKKNYGKPCKTLAFKQTTNKYRNDSLKSSTTWTEYLEYPDKLRIEFGDTLKGNFVVFKNDSSYNYREFAFYKKDENKNLIMLLLGGMYFRKIDDVLKRINAEGIDLSLISEQQVNGKDCYVIGASKPDSNIPQICINKSTLLLESFTERSNGALLRVDVAERQKACNTEVETKLLIYVDGKLYQEELYYDTKFNQPVPKGKFDTKQ
ncbi:MAG: hypothetical protein K0S33_2593 [Bacteroidetes bacterium]|jgi:hypothetical protein|nr:hypothetical protein [Bacteroidota bacterium]